MERLEANCGQRGKKFAGRDLRGLGRLFDRSCFLLLFIKNKKKNKKNERIKKQKEKE